MSSATVLLGLAPVLLQMADPSVNEIALISVQRPGLAVLLAFGSAAIYPSRMFGYRQESFQELKDLIASPSLFSDSLIRLLQNNSGVQMSVCAVQYLVAAASIFNTI